MDETVTAIGTPNIAFIKYWGKRNEKLNLPSNSSVSMTVDEQLNTKTSILFTDRLSADRVYINGEMQDVHGAEMMERLVSLEILRRLAGEKRKALVVSENSFPAGSGLASSASGLATLTYTAAKALGLKLTPREMSMIARRGSGSACRSLFGGIVKWRKGVREDGSDSYAEQVVRPNYWPELIDIVVVLTRARKKVSSHVGHGLTTKTSVLYKSRLAYVENAVARLIAAVKERNFETLGELIMRDSNNMHATMLDTWPPLLYLNDSSKEVIYRVHELNESEGKIVAAYTFDAGANAQVITLKRNVGKVTRLLGGIESVNDVIKLKMGNGPRVLGESDSLIDERTLRPRSG